MSPNLGRAAASLVAQIAMDPWGQVTASPYETGRLVSVAPWLAGHQARLAYLCRSQHPDGGWGGTGGYALTSTLSATAGLLAELQRGGPEEGVERVDRAAAAGLRALHRWLAPGAALPIPDTIASELVIPALVAEVNRLLPGPDKHGADKHAANGAGDAQPVPLPDGFDPRPLERLHAGLVAGRFPPRLAYSLEVFGSAAVASPVIRPAEGDAAGAVGLSPAATAAWLGGKPGGDHAGYAFLDRLQARHGGPVPVVSPITYFEAAWVLNGLALAGLSSTVPAVILDRLQSGLREGGAPVAPGLPPDADDTGAVLAALLRHGRSPSLESLLGFHADGYFRCYHGERDPSVSTNAHALEALALHLARHPRARTRFDAMTAAATATAKWLVEIQQPDGTWWDKWHSSPYYTTAGCVIALTELLTELGHAGAPAAVARAIAHAVDRAVAWVRDTEHPDGSWGRWQGTVEETAYAVQILTHAAGDPAVAAALGRAAKFLATQFFAEEAPDYPPLWHGKDLYTPVRVVRAAHLAALATAGRAATARVPRQRQPSAQVGAQVEADR